MCVTAVCGEFPPALCRASFSGVLRYRCICCQCIAAAKVYGRRRRARRWRSAGELATNDQVLHRCSQYLGVSKLFPKKIPGTSGTSGTRSIWAFMNDGILRVLAVFQYLGVPGCGILRVLAVFPRFYTSDTAVLEVLRVQYSALSSISGFCTAGTVKYCQCILR